MRITHDIGIAAPPERVFAVYLDPDRVPEWRPSVAEIADRSGPMDATGTAFTTRYSNRTPESHGTVIESDPPRRHVLAGKGAVRYRSVITCEADGAGGTRLRFELEVTLPGGPVGRLAGRAFIAKKVERETLDELQRLKGLAEAA